MANQEEGVGTRKMWIKVIKIDLKKQNISVDLAYDGLEWKNKIHVAAQYNWDKTLTMLIMNIYLISG